MNSVDMIGWLAGSLVLATFYLRSMVPLRCVALASNVAFITYGVMADALPILVLHSLLLPMNLWRLYELQRLHQRMLGKPPAAAFRSGCDNGSGEIESCSLTITSDKTANVPLQAPPPHEVDSGFYLQRFDCRRTTASPARVRSGGF